MLLAILIGVAAGTAIVVAVIWPRRTELAEGYRRAPGRRIAWVVAGLLVFLVLQFFGFLFVLNDHPVGEVFFVLSVVLLFGYYAASKRGWPG
jgi:hypothetical protein